MKVETIKIGKSSGGSFYYAINGGAERTCNPSRLEFIPSDSYKTLQILKSGIQLFNDVIEKVSVGDTQLTPENAKELLDGLNATMGGGVVDSKDKGSFLTEAELEAAHPDPESGWYAGVGSPALKYVVSGGVWTATTEEYSPGGSVDPNAFVSKEEYRQFQQNLNKLLYGVTTIENIDEFPASSRAVYFETNNNVAIPDVEVLEDRILRIRNTSETEVIQIAIPNTNGWRDAEGLGVIDVAPGELAELNVLIAEVKSVRLIGTEV